MFDFPTHKLLYNRLLGVKDAMDRILFLVHLVQVGFPLVSAEDCARLS